MSIADSFDESRPLIGPDDLYTKGNISDICIATFSCEVLQDVLKRYDHREEVCAFTANGKIPVYSLLGGEHKILFYMSPIGAAYAGCIMEEVSYLTGATNFIVFGSCGSLDHSMTDGKLIIPTESYRDEGFSYHYQKAGDYMEITNSKKISELFEKLSVPHVCGRSWTTDAIYRETEANAARRKADGCIAVEMESAGLQALCTFKRWELYPFFFASDLVDGEVWQNISLGTAEERRHQINCFETALRLAEVLIKENTRGDQADSGK